MKTKLRSLCTRIANDKRMAVLVFILELCTFITLLLLADSSVAKIFERDTLLATHLSIEILIVILLVCQYLSFVSEYIVSHREEERQFTLPITLLPFGNLLRFAILFVLELLAVIPKLIFYFFSVLFAFVFMILHIDRFMPGNFVDIFDHLMESYEIKVNKMFNLLHFNKIKANSSVFSSVFNSFLTLWCINH